MKLIVCEKVGLPFFMFLFRKRKFKTVLKINFYKIGVYSYLAET
jgi:hypothetical protein